MAKSSGSIVEGLPAGAHFSDYTAEIFSDPAAVLYVIKVYMNDFFGCEYCRDHFLTVLSSCYFGSCVPSLVSATTKGSQRFIKYDNKTHDLYKAKSMTRLYEYKANYALVLLFWKLHNFVLDANLRFESILEQFGTYFFDRVRDID